MSNEKEQYNTLSANDDIMDYDINTQIGLDTTLNDKENVDPEGHRFIPSGMWKIYLLLVLMCEVKYILDNAKIDDNNSGTGSDEEDPYSSDDSVSDPDYDSSSSSNSSDSSSSSNSSGDNKVEISNTINPSVEPNTSKKRTRKRKADPSEWKKFTTKRLRNSGKAYKTLGKGVPVSERKMKPPCDNSKCKQKCSTKFTEEDRLDLFKKYWEMGDIVKQRTYILSLIQEVNPAYRYPRNADGRVANHAFYFLKEGKKLRVCKYFFIATLGITVRCIRTLKAKIKESTVAEDNRGKHSNHKEIPKEIKDGVRAHILSIPTIESHYTRAHSEKLYIDGSKTIAQLHRDYKAECDNQRKPFANLTMYRNIFNHEFNIAFFVPKKDQCQACVNYENSNEEEKEKLREEHNTHIEEKQLSREEKEKDKKSISSSYQVACFDLQASLPTPNGQVSSFYYRSKLSTYNFTVADLTLKGQGPVNCYMWHEGEGKRGAVEIGTCLLHYLKEKAAACNTDDLEIVFYSDNCAGQQKNKFVIAAYLYAVANYKIKSITHKYLVTGHTQNEGDNAHSLIEKNIKRALKSGPIYTPSQYTAIVQTAKKTGKPFNVIEMSHEDFLDLKHLTEHTTINNFQKNTMSEIFRMSDASVISVEKSHLDSFFYKTSFKSTDFKQVKVINERRSRTPLSTFADFDLKKAYTNSIPISKKKYDDLMFLLRTNAIKNCHSYFYKSLNFE